MRRLLSLAVLGALAVAAPADAATLKLVGPAKKVKFEGAAGEGNAVTITQLDALKLRVTDTHPISPDGPLTALGATCVIVSSSTAECTLPAPEWRFQASLQDGDDTATVDADTLPVNLRGGLGDDTLTGGNAADDLEGDEGADTLDGGLGADGIDGGADDDTILARDGVKDDVVCGLGADSGKADLEDTLTDCESVEQPLAPQTIATPPAAPAGPAPLPADPQAPANAPAPNPGVSVAGGIERGKVLVKGKARGQRFITLDPTKPLPVGATVDARRGVVTITSAADLSGTTQTARFTGGMFTVTQKRGKRMTTVLTLKGTLKCAKGSNRKTARAAGTGKKRRLWGSGHGRFTTRGRNSQATVRGTIWTVEDRCGGTMTRVQRGAVSVKDFVSGRTRLVRAGGRYFARNRTKNAR